MNREANMYLATILRKVGDLHEASWNGKGYGHYTKTYRECMIEAGVCESDPLTKILACLFTAGYCDMWEFCDETLGKATP